MNLTKCLGKTPSTSDSALHSTRPIQSLTRAFCRKHTIKNLEEVRTSTSRKQTRPCDNAVLCPGNEKGGYMAKKLCCQPSDTPNRLLIRYTLQPREFPERRYSPRTRCCGRPSRGRNPSAFLTFSPKDPWQSRPCISQTLRWDFDIRIGWGTTRTGGQLAARLHRANSYWTLQGLALFSLGLWGTKGVLWEDCSELSFGHGRPKSLPHLLRTVSAEHKPPHIHLRLVTVYVHLRWLAFLVQIMNLSDGKYIIKVIFAIHLANNRQGPGKLSSGIVGWRGVRKGGQNVWLLAVWSRTTRKTSHETDPIHHLQNLKLSLLIALMRMLFQLPGWGQPFGYIRLNYSVVSTSWIPVLVQEQ